MSPTKTNPEYAAMAYRKAILGECVTHLLRFTPAMGEEPKGRIYSEDTIRDDSEVPQDDLQDFILSLQQEAESLRLEMAKFDFVKRDHDTSQHSQKPAPSAQENGQFKRKRRHNHTQ